MILVDTSVWIDFFRGTPAADPLGELLVDNRVLLHSGVRGELALGNLGRRREKLLRDLDHLPRAPLVDDSEVLEMIEARKLHGRGVGWVDCHLLAAALIAGARLWSFDRRLSAAATKLRLSAKPPLSVRSNK